ncbi:uncharacterized protein METZ01_LOCUS81526 [marine metagenome]|uniref:Uncharacterized protein n=1 Tax=marine metagenome TaxID=408172 RepID=A0A381UKG3_9ZZZZ
METKGGTLESSILDVWKNAADIQEKKVSETNKNDKSDDGEGLDAVQPKAVKKKFKDRKDTDIDNDGDTDSSDKFLHKRRKAISKAVKADEEITIEQAQEFKVQSMREALRQVWETDLQEKGMPPWLDKKKEKDEGNAFGSALKSAKEKGDKTFVVSGKKYNVEDFDDKDSKGKTDTGGKKAEVEINPKMDEKKK